MDCVEEIVEVIVRCIRIALESLMTAEDVCQESAFLEMFVVILVRIISFVLENVPNVIKENVLLGVCVMINVL